MKNPDAPFLELAFYFPDLDSDESLEKVVHWLVSNGAVIRSVFTSEREQSPHTGETLPAEQKIHSPEAATEILSRESASVTKVLLENGTRIIPNTREFVAQLPISQHAASCDHNPVAVWVEGAAFSCPQSEDVPSSARRIGARALAVFKELITGLAPAYGAITVDYGLECPADLKEDPRTHAFTDCYLASKFVGNESLSLIRHIAPQAYHESFHAGQITFCSPFLAPENLSLTNIDSLDFSKKVGSIVAYCQ